MFGDKQILQVIDVWKHIIALGFVYLKYTYGGIRARRQCAEQENPGSQSHKPHWLKGVVAMMKYVFFKMKLFNLDALTIVGWTSFVFGVFIVEPAWFKLVLLSVARVMP